MTAPRTRLSEGETEFERELLESWGSEQPSEEARKGAHAIVLPALGTAVAGSLAAGAVSKLGAAAGSAPAKAAVLGWHVGHWIAVGSVVAAAGGVAVRYATSDGHLAGALPAPVVTVQTTAPSPTAPRVRVAEGLPTDRTDATRTREQLPPSGPVSKSLAQRALARSEASAAPDDKRSKVDLGQEVAALDRARAALATGDAAGALRLLDNYEASFPKASLAQEGTILRIEALLKQGNRDAAVDLGNRFLAQHPGSSHSAKVRQLLIEGSNM
jgi:hypothetical protein